MERCLECNKEYKDVMQHVRGFHKLSNMEYKTKHELFGVCKLCGDKLQVPSKCCCPEHLKLWNANKKYDGKIEGQDYIICRVCGFKAGSLISHITDYHNLTMKDYHEKYNTNTSNVICGNASTKLSERVKGDKNPAYQHGGKLSAFSKNFIKYEGLSDTEIDEKIDKVCKTNSISMTNNDNCQTNINYWLKHGYNEEEAKEKLSFRQTTFSLEKCIEKYGVEAGTKRWQERQKKWQDNIKSKPLEELERINRAKMNFCKGFSMISQKLFWQIYDEIKDGFNKVYFAELFNGERDTSGNNHEYCYISENRNVYFLDFYVKDINKTIEFDGDYWHGEKRGNQERDRIRDAEITNASIQVLHIQEREFKKNPDRIVKECIDWLK